MKTIILTAIILTCSVCYAQQTPMITYDPNTVIESPNDPNNVILTIVVEITKQQHESMKDLGKTLYGAVVRSALRRILDGWTVQATALLSKEYNYTELKAKLEQE